MLEDVGGSVETLSGVQRPRSYTSHAMTQYAYTRAQHPGPGQPPPLGSGDADEQERPVVEHGLDAPGEFLPAPVRRRAKTWW